MAQDLLEQFLQLRRTYIEHSLSRLNSMQRKAALTTEGPLLILAGAGSGKTTVLIQRIANLVLYGKAYHSEHVYGTVTPEAVELLRQAVETGTQPAGFEQVQPMLSVGAVRPWNVLAITFTNKAAGELKSRLEARLGEAGQDVNASTFHSACVRILRRDAERLGFPKSFTIYDSDDQKRVMKDVYKELMVDDKFLNPRSALSQIGRMKDQLISPKDALSAQADTKEGLVAKIYDLYARKLRAAGAMDFDDLIYHTVCLLQDNPDILEYYQNKFRYILVDEYQDTSVAQFHLVRMLASGHNNVCVVGDDDQSIYRFRGATIENILNFEQHFPGAQVIRLEQNYRSTSHILDAANCVIKNNSGRKGKTLWTENGAGEKVFHYLAENEHEEASHVATIIGANLKKGAELKDHAILYRMNAQSGPIETYFARAGIPYKIVGGQRFYDRKEIKDVLAYMCIVANPQDDLRLRRIINEPGRKIGGTTLDRIAEIANGLGVSMLEVCQHAREYPALARAGSALAGFCKIYDDLCEAHDTMPLDGFVTELLEVTGYRAMLEADKEKGPDRLENVGQLISSVRTYADQKGPEASLAGFLEEVALISDIDSYNEDSDVVVLMTMHAAKGLEFNYVFIVGMEEGVFPSDMVRYSDEELEEERRLCYVGITRAKKELYLSSSQSRMIFGRTQRNNISRFVDEINPDLLEQETSPSIQRAMSRGWGSNRLFSDDDASMRRAGRSSLGGGFGMGFGGGSTAPAASGRSWPGAQRSAAPAAPAASSAPRRMGGSFGGGFAGGSAPAAPRPAAPPASTSKGTFQPGDQVDHKVFGRGKVLKVTPVAGDTIVEIQFEKVGVKKTMANYAPIKKVEE